MKEKIQKTVGLVLFLLNLSVITFAQEKTKITPYIQLQYFKNSNDSSYLQTSLTYSLNRMEIPIPGKEILFYFKGGGKNLTGSGLSDHQGIARFNIERSALQADKEGLWKFSAEFKGNDTIEAVASEISVKDLNLEMTLSEADSIKKVLLRVTTFENRKEIPVSNEVVMVYVPRMFSLLPIAEASLDESGMATVEFPSDLPGDTNGNLTIISRIVENPSYGNIERKIVKKWGVPASLSTPVSHRALWTKTPPRWMIITLSILLAGVWGHYLFAIISLIMIKRDSNKKKNQKISTSK
jgi:hypothetical protein